MGMTACDLMQIKEYTFLAQIRGDVATPLSHECCFHCRSRVGREHSINGAIQLPSFH